MALPSRGKTQEVGLHPKPGDHRNLYLANEQPRDRWVTGQAEPGVVDPLSAYPPRDPRQMTFTRRCGPQMSTSKGGRRVKATCITRGLQVLCPGCRIKNANPNSKKAVCTVLDSTVTPTAAQGEQHSVRTAAVMILTLYRHRWGTARSFARHYACQPAVHVDYACSTTDGVWNV